MAGQAESFSVYMMATAEKGSTLARWRRRMAANVKGKKRSLHNVEEENGEVVVEKERRTVLENRQAFRTIDNKMNDVFGARKPGTLRSSKTCTEDGRKVGIVPPQAAVRSEPMREPTIVEAKPSDMYMTESIADIPTKRSRKGRGPPFAIPVPRPVIPSDHCINLNTLGWAIDTLMKPPENVRDIDADTSELFMHPEYHADIINYLRSIENKYAHRSMDFLEVGEVTPQMRTILVDWLIQVQLHLMLLDETLHLSVALMDRFISRKPVQLSKFQLLGISCLFVAAKYTERFAPEIDTLIHLTDRTYTYQQVLDMEITILTSLKFDVGFADPYQFMERCLKAASCSDQTMRYACMYLLDLSLVDAQFIIYKPSLLAAAVVCLVRQIFNDPKEQSWTPTLAYYSGYSMTELIPCMKRLSKSVRKMEHSKYKAAQDKYSSKDYNGVSKLEVFISSPVLFRLDMDEK